MPSKFAETTQGKFNWTSAPGLSDDARQAVDAAFDAMSTWRREAVKGVEQVTEKMSAAARALGWPEQIVDTTRTQIENITKMQNQTMDRILDAWEEQIKSPNSSAMLSKLNSLPSFGPAGSWINANASGTPMASLNPMQFYVQFAEQWQKACTDAMAFWGTGRGT
jgi:hypothetical protein